MTNNTILLIDDEEKLRTLLARILSLEGYAVKEAMNAQSALRMLEKEAVPVILCDVKLPDANGVELTQKLKALYPDTEIILLTAYGTISDGVAAMKNGAFDYLTKGDDNDRIIPLVARAMEKVRLQQKVKQLEEKIAHQKGFATILGESAAIHQAVALARKVAAAQTTVLLLGETGTGKEVFAQAIHAESPRRHRNFVAVNCSAFSREILESELFGHRAGAFTGATKDKRGLLDEADGGTLFLDEIGEMSLDLQAKLLRVLETQQFYRVGDVKPVSVEVRFVAATNRNLAQEAEADRFRLDLYYRLSVFEITLPALRDRLEDLELLTRHFVQVYANKMNKKVASVAPEFMVRLRQHSWKGNVRELKNVIERAVILMDNEQLTPAELPYEWQNMISETDKSSLALADMEKLHIQRVLAHTQGNKTEAAHLLGIGLTTLYRKLDEYGMTRHE
jgi:DNA-binding NtrC family response regulator